MKLRSLKKFVSCLSIISVLAVSSISPGIFAASPVNSDKTAAETVYDMGVGWNLGNTLDACDTTNTHPNVTAYETLWGNPVTTQKMIDGIKDAGFRSVRIPVAWSNLMSSDYTINADLLKRVKEIADYCTNDGMYVLVNIHWDGGWFDNFATNYDESMKKYTRVWTQISNYFKDYSNNLVFESLNEEGCWNSIWNRWSGTTGEAKTKAYSILNNINQKFVDIVRASGGNNTTRCLLIAGYATDIDLTCDDCFKMPTDTISNKLMISVHYYTPSTFTILTEDASWGKFSATWGTDAEINQVKTDFNKMKTKFADKGYPVIIGEYGTTTVNKESASVRRYLSTVCKTGYDLGFCPMLWDSSVHYSRSDKKIPDTELAAMYLTYKDGRTTVKLGDVNGDGSVNALDFAMMKSYLLGKITDFPVENDLKVSDLNGDGVFNALDFAVMKQFLLGKITAFPAEK